MRSHLGAGWLGFLAGALAVTGLCLALLSDRVLSDLGGFSARINQQSLERHAEDMLDRLAGEKAARANLILAQAEARTRLMADAVARALERAPGVEPADDFVLHTDKGIFSNGPDAPASAVYWGEPDMGPDVRRRMAALRNVDPVLTAARQDVPGAAAAWFILKEGLARYHPNIRLVEKMPPVGRFDYRDDICFLAGAPERNPQGRTRWIEIYQDSVDQGLMITAVSPVRDAAGEFLGTAGLDLSVEAFVGRIDNDGVREGRLLWPGDDLAVVLTGSGRPVAYPMEAAELFGLKESDFRDLERGELLEQSLLDSPDPSVRRLAREMVQGVSGVRHMRLGASDVLVAHHPLPTLGWSLGLVLPLTDVLTSVQQTREAIVQARAALQRRFLQVLGVLLLLFGGLCAVYFQRRVHRPLQRLADAIEQTAIGQMDRRVAVDAPDELGRLGQAFNRMADNLQRHQEQLFRAEEMYHGIFLNAQEGIFQATGQGRLLAANPSMARMLGYDAPEALLRGVGDFRRDFPAEPGEWESVQERLERQGRVSSHRMRMRRRDGGRVWVLLSIGLMRAGDGDAGVYEGVVMDVTQWQAAADQVQALTRKLLKTQETERQRLAADLHDNVAQNLSSLKLACATLFDEHPEVPADLRRRVEAMGNILRQSINDVRDLAYGLRPPTLDQLGLARAVQQHCQEVAENTGLAIRFRARDAHEGRLDPEVEINVYRLAQEALRNVVRHAQAREALVELGRDNGELRLVVQDDGKGFHVSTGLAAAMERRRMGLHGMSQRAELLHGALRIESSPGQGTRVEALVPLERKGRGNEGDDERGVAGG